MLILRLNTEIGDKKKPEKFPKNLTRGMDYDGPRRKVEVSVL